MVPIARIVALGNADNPLLSTPFSSFAYCNESWQFSIVNVGHLEKTFSAWQSRDDVDQLDASSSKYQITSAPSLIAKNPSEPHRSRVTGTAHFIWILQGLLVRNLRCNSTAN
jgi:hypothetical protein